MVVTRIAAAALIVFAQAATRKMTQVPGGAQNLFVFFAAGAGIGMLGSTINPFATVIASNAAWVPFTAGMPLRFAILGLGWLACVTHVLRYAERVRWDPLNRSSTPWRPATVSAS